MSDETTARHCAAPLGRIGTGENNDPSRTTDAGRARCAQCRCEVKAYSTCDRATGSVWCFDCFPETPCGKGWHGEGCSTNVFEDGPPAKSDAVHWRCFHCGDVFTKAQERWAREHFGRDQGETPVCQMRVPGEGSLLTALRRAQDELAGYRQEDTDLVRALVAQASDHAERVREAEEQGYAKALRDVEAGKVEPAHARRIVAALEGVQDGE